MNTNTFDEESLKAAMRLFEGDAEAAKLWLNRPAKALGGLCPKDVPPDQVSGLVEKIEQGVLS